MRLYDGKQYDDQVFPMALEKYLNKLPYLVFTKLHHVRSTGTVKVSALFICVSWRMSGNNGIENISISSCLINNCISMSEVNRQGERNQTIPLT